eukprot:4646135-Amphidinium_carterae.1
MNLSFAPTLVQVPQAQHKLSLLPESRERDAKSPPLLSAPEACRYPPVQVDMVRLHTERFG